ncbi:unnamed protein product [Chrysoparadoxa australica]
MPAGCVAIPLADVCSILQPHLHALSLMLHPPLPHSQMVHAGINPDPASGAILTPIVQSTTFVQDSVETYLDKGYSYSRTANPTVKVLEDKVALLEHGVGASCFATGMAATITVMTACLKAGDHCVITDTSYGGTNRAARVMFSNLGITYSFIDFRDIALVEAAIQPNTKLLFSETPANPTLTLTDVAAVSKLAQDKGLVHVCDSTFSTPLMCCPLDLGADMIITSLTKFYDGHNVTVGGAVASATQDWADKIKFFQNVLGNIISPPCAFYILQNVKTMGLRFSQQCATAQAVAEMLEKHPKVQIVRYPGLKSFPQKELADRQHMNGIHGSMVCFEVYGGTDMGRKLMNSVKRPWSLCENLGATESIITCPAVMTHANMLKEDRLKVGITDGFVRVSCGIEETEDLVSVLKEALDFL